MAGLSPVALASLMFEDNYLSGLVLLDDLANNLRMGHQRGTDLVILAVRHHEDLIDPDFITHLAVQTLNPHTIPFLILLPPRLENRIHTVTSLKPKKQIQT